MRYFTNRFIGLLIFTWLGTSWGIRCQRAPDKTQVPNPEEQTIAQTFVQVDSLLSLDNGSFWNTPLSGPVLLVHPETRLLYANENDEAGSFQKLGTIFKDSLPLDINISNTALEWNNKRWSMVMLPLPKDEIPRCHLIIHELFHRIQPTLGFGNIKEMDNGHLDTFDGRLLLKLELEALEQALLANSKKSTLTHVQNALIFRTQRYGQAVIKAAENSLELNEGLAEYTALMLSGRNKASIRQHLIQSKNAFIDNPSFIRSFAYQTVPMYGFLLAQTKPNWQGEISPDTNLTDYFTKSFGIEWNADPSWKNIAEQNKYHYEQILDGETKRESARLEKLKILKEKFLVNPTLEISFRNMNISFDYRIIVPIENHGTVYPKLRVTDDWGVLNVENGALITSDWTKVIVAAPTKIDKKEVFGEGWELSLNNGWKVVGENKNFKLIKE